jgi:predicted nucleotidyltransferase
MPLSRDRALSVLRGALPDLRTRYHVRALKLFGSVARGEARPGSDVDVLVDFSEPVGLFVLLDLRRHLSEILGEPVDLGTEGSLRPRARDAILGEAILVR